MRILIIITLFALILPACAQNRYIKKAFAFSLQINSGAPPVYKNGVAISKSKTKEFIYIETTGSTKPKINEVFYKGILYNEPEVFLAGHEQLKAGVNKSTGKPLILSPAKGNNLWRIEIVTTDKEGDQPISNQNNIIVKGKNDGHSFSIKINEEIELKPLIGY